MDRINLTDNEGYFLYANPTGHLLITPDGKKVGQKIKQGKKNQQGKPGSGKPGNEAGEEYYEVEITLEELAQY